MSDSSRIPGFLWSPLLLLNRLSVGWYMFLAGWRKVQMEWAEGWGAFYRGDGYQDRLPAWLPEWLAAGHGYSLPWVELIFGLLLLLGLYTRTSAVVLFLLSVSIAIALAGAGDLWPRHHIMLFLTITPLLAVSGSGAFGLDPIVRRARARRKKAAPDNGNS